MSEVQAQDENKPRLTEAQKRQNHISSEQKRRQAIRDGFDKLSNMVPGLEGMGRSEGLVLNRTVEHILLQIQERKDLIAQIEAKGIVVDDVYKR
ncbi:hypothetical protein M406DRAFT_42026 [Cryphonectria parasitica EP155]|uniref:BHLH domain-containing protein n=1 Tax=Cryphonectria parasitica (strain ATCC 38755 / EP155) TaxID=660469 RepID=A0A9P4Y0F3_CRYP1|nr:uncharacterized protein M406DRAFT_42026 [Cryphonectria parasitica EP155]KAF3764709.1 hypothetical protein M406DRAFT_42026 [Cryphonectria parasitica EP155]